MALTARDRQVLAQLRRDPRTSVTDLALRMDVPSAEIRSSIGRLEQEGLLVGRGWLLGTRQPVVVLGGAAMDLKMRTVGEPVLGTSNPAQVSWEPGGVARNIAEGLARLGQPVELVATIGNDSAAAELVTATRAAGVGTDHLIRVNAPTGVFVSIVDRVGGIVMAASDLQATDLLTVRMLVTKQALIARSEVIVIDGNLPPVVAGWVLDFARAAGRPVVLDLVSSGKAASLRGILSEDRPVHTLVPSIEELAGLLGLAELADEVPALTRAAEQAHDLGVTHVWIRRGPHGSLLSCLEDGVHDVHELPPPRAKVLDITGVGDAMTAGYVHSLLSRGDVVEAARFGQATGSLTVESRDTVRPDLTEDLVTERLARGSRNARRRG